MAMEALLWRGHETSGISQSIHPADKPIDADRFAVIGDDDALVGAKHLILSVTRFE